MLFVWIEKYSQLPKHIVEKNVAMKNAPYVCNFNQDYISAWHDPSQQIKKSSETRLFTAFYLVSAVIILIGNIIHK